MIRELQVGDTVIIKGGLEVEVYSIDERLECIFDKKGTTYSFPFILGIKPRFYQLYKDGKVTAEDIHDFIHAWHNGPSKIDLHKYLGLTWEQYGHWVETNELPEK